jgi:8-oxo-dGTP diphosphatase
VLGRRCRGLSYRQSYRWTGAATLVTDELRWPRTVLVFRHPALRFLRQRAELISAAVAARARIVVGAALIEDGRVLAACRAQPRAHAGFWELPGGKVEPGESPESALHRECLEELGVEIVLRDRLGSDLVLGGTAVLRVWSARLAGGAPVAREHAELRWLAASELESVEWLPADRVLLPELRYLLAHPTAG